MTNTLGIMLEFLGDYPWTRLSVGITGAIKRQFFHMVTHFDNNNLSQESFVIDTWRVVICSLGDGRKHMLTILRTKVVQIIKCPCNVFIDNFRNISTNSSI